MGALAKITLVFKDHPTCAPLARPIMEIFIRGPSRDTIDDLSTQFFGEKLSANHMDNLLDGLTHLGGLHICFNLGGEDNSK